VYVSVYVRVCLQQAEADVLLRGFTNILGKDYEKEFAKADVDKDGKLSEPELKGWVTSLLTPSEEDKEEEEEHVAAPTARQYYAAFVCQTVPFIGFGIMDNGIMIIAGDQIDLTLGVTLGLSTMAAAGLGNLVSDIVGVSFSGSLSFLSPLSPALFLFSLSFFCTHTLPFSPFLSLSACWYASHSR
jgi:hypothetical protein